MAIGEPKICRCGGIVTDASYGQSQECGCPGRVTMSEWPSPEWSLRYEGRKHVLMRRSWGPIERPPRYLPWEDVATFDDYNRAEEVLRILQRGGDDE